MDEKAAAEQKQLARERKEALGGINGAARYLPQPLQRKLNSALRELVTEIGKVRETHERTQKKK